jgi:hypothetical protein
MENNDKIAIDFFKHKNSLFDLKFKLLFIKPMT